MSNNDKISAADLGTNTIKVTHATRSQTGDLFEMEHASATVRLGFGIEKTGRIEDARLEACLDFLKHQQQLGEQYGSTAFIGVATEALRIAANGKELMARIEQETNWTIEIISGNREAELTYLGLSDQVPSNTDCAIVDIGGGSTEVVVIQDGMVVAEQSIPVGSGRLADRHFESDPPGTEAVDLAIQSASKAIAELLDPDLHVGFIMLAGGSGLFMNQLIEQLWHEPPFDSGTLTKLARYLANARAKETVDRIGIPLARAQVLPASIAVGVAIMDKFGAKKALGVPSGIRMGLIREFGKKCEVRQ